MIGELNLAPKNISESQNLIIVIWCLQLTNMSFTSYVTENILKPANLTNTYYWLGGQGMEPQGLRKKVVSLPSYTTTFQNSSGGESTSPI